MRSEAEIRDERELVAQLAENAPRGSDTEAKWRHRAEVLAWVLEDGDDGDE